MAPRPVPGTPENAMVGFSLNSNGLLTVARQLPRELHLLKEIKSNLMKTTVSISITVDIEVG